MENHLHAEFDFIIPPNLIQGVKYEHYVGGKIKLVQKYLAPTPSTAPSSMAGSWVREPGQDFFNLSTMFGGSLFRYYSSAQDPLKSIIFDPKSSTEFLNPSPFCALIWAVYASPGPVPSRTGPSDSVKQKDLIIRSLDVFQPIEVVRAAEIDNDIEGREPPNGSGAGATCIIA
ncbi:hypothetical protein DFH08DRAFT_807043 [Mycena albidolilacea]|uniref:Uncharacterized protein n=1 Tax=Mycena albidolilacea TaxID=1033008 RepID=A0AAD7ETG1_9AGAR|nr:hypothetical protein DFH08DRAFT_807043 [Mycena albidolilacea]